MLHCGPLGIGYPRSCWEHVDYTTSGSILVGSQLHAAMSYESCMHTSIIIKPLILKNLDQEDWAVMVSGLIAIAYSSVTCAIVLYDKG